MLSSSKEEKATVGAVAFPDLHPNPFPAHFCALCLMTLRMHSPPSPALRRPSHSCPLSYPVLQDLRQDLLEPWCWLGGLAHTGCTGGACRRSWWLHTPFPWKIGSFAGLGVTKILTTFQILTVLSNSAEIGQNT